MATATADFLLQGATADALPVIGTGVKPASMRRTYQATVTGTGALTATVPIDVSNDGQFYLLMGTITLAGTDFATDGFVSEAPWVFVRARVTDVTGVGAAVDVRLSVAHETSY